MLAATADRALRMQELGLALLNLSKSPLYCDRIQNQMQPVLGEGNLHAQFMLIGEAPGRNEAQTGRPFCGSAGKILDALLQSIQFSRADIFITNIVKDRPPENRDPSPQEIEIYGPLLDEQIDLIQPQVLVTLGRFSMQYIFKKFHLEHILQSISKMHGKVFQAQASYGPIQIVPLYHPACAMYNPNMKDILKKDFQILKTCQNSVKKTRRPIEQSKSFK